MMPHAVPRPAWHAVARFALWLALALPALYQLALLVEAIAGRVGYPYDLEWMEGGMLHHALRIRLGLGIYAAPSVDFIPYLYTPLYPTLLALFGGPFGISYTLGRAMSIVGLIGIAGTTLTSLLFERQRPVGAALAGAALALGLFAACYPYVEGWYDIVRADSLFVFMITAGIAGLLHWARDDDGIVGHGKVAAGAALLALAFFCKQTGICYVALGGVIVVVLNWRRAPSYAAMAGVIGLGGSWVLNRSTGGWFWTYISEIHRAHDFNMARFRDSFGHILWHFPAASIVIAAGLVLVAATAWRRRCLPAAARPFLLWTCTYAVSTAVGAIGFGTEFAHFNAYIPALLHGALAAGAAVPAACACGQLLWGGRRHAQVVATLAGIAAAAPLAITCALSGWQPQRYIPTVADVTAGDRLIEHLRGIDGAIWIPSHPWYAFLAGKPPHVHRMGIKDVTTRQSRMIDGLDDELRRHGFAAIILDNRDLALELPALGQFYHRDEQIPDNERPRLYTGAGNAGSGNLLVPDAIWRPSLPGSSGVRH